MARRCSWPSFETPRKRAAPQDEGYADDTGGLACCEAPRGMAHAKDCGGINRCVRGFRKIPPLTNCLRFGILNVAPIVSTGAKGEFVMAKGQMRSNKEKKKPKADKNLKKGGAAPSPFASGKTPAGQNPGKK
jgi:hypothetical protein